MTTIRVMLGVSKILDVGNVVSAIGIMHRNEFKTFIRTNDIAIY